MHSLIENIYKVHIFIENPPKLSSPVLCSVTYEVVASHYGDTLLARACAWPLVCLAHYMAEQPYLPTSWL